MRMLVMGAGAVGSVVGGFMAKAGHEVHFVGRQAHMNAIAEHELRISGIWGEHRVRNIETFTKVPAAGEVYDFILMAVKAYDTESATHAIKPFVGPETLVCSYQNGLGNAETMAAILGWEHILDARVIFGVWLPEPGHAEVTVTADATSIGCYRDAVPMPRIEAHAKAMDEAGIPSRATDTIATYLWGKVAYNCALNPLSALLGIPYGGLLEMEDTRYTMREIIHELYAVGRAMDVALRPPTPEEYIERLFDHLIPVTADHYASMHEDLRRGRRTEIDALNGAICRFGAEYGIPCPTNTVLSRLIRAREHVAVNRRPA
jgi:2-dehydropantoate 2-reductase